MAEPLAQAQRLLEALLRDQLEPGRAGAHEARGGVAAAERRRAEVIASALETVRRRRAEVAGGQSTLRQCCEEHVGLVVQVDLQAELPELRQVIKKARRPSKRAAPRGSRRPAKPRSTAAPFLCVGGARVGATVPRSPRPRPRTNSVGARGGSKQTHAQHRKPTLAQVELQGDFSQIRARRPAGAQALQRNQFPDDRDAKYFRRAPRARPRTAQPRQTSALAHTLALARKGDCSNNTENEHCSQRPKSAFARQRVGVEKPLGPGLVQHRLDLRCPIQESRNAMPLRNVRPTPDNMR